MENFFASGLRATYGPRSEAELAFGNPCAERTRSTQWKECFHTVENFFDLLFRVLPPRFGPEDGSLINTSFL